ncbi:tetratricopeptide repeat protein [Halostreptopolyspora alba]|uniref:Uncharacterized protein n=1 Tax=Halostreptopolyspora alba TaxID=2487137 RepID=A0A3N0E6J9_9ACTN|nr:hypothetical protein EFW17_15795 [Nocardiopsaceae bacterium YIM 96095]
MSPPYRKAAMLDMTRPDDDTPQISHVANTVAGGVSGVSVQAESVTNAIIRQTVHVQHHHGGRDRMRLDSPSWIVSRDDAAAAFGAAVREGRERVVVVNVCGPSGIGKTALAVSLLHDLCSRHPGRFAADPLMVRFGEQTLDGAVADVLCEIGVRPGDIPLERSDRHALYRARTHAFGPIALLLDDVATPGVVETLLPVAPGSVVVVTSQHELDDLDRESVPSGGLAPLCRLKLGPLADEDAVLLFSLRSAQEYAPDSAPTWLRAATAHTGGRPDVICQLAARYADVPDEPAAPTRPGLEVAPSPRGSLPGKMTTPFEEPEPDTLAPYNELAEHERRLLRCLVWHPETLFAGDLVTSLAEIPEAEATELIRGWCRWQLLGEFPGDAGPRYAFPSAVRDRLRERSRAEDSGAERVAFVELICGHYLRWARAAHALLLPDRWLVGGSVGEPSRSFTDHHAALAWLERERRPLNRVVHLAYENGLHATVCQLCEVLWALYFKRSYYVDLIETHDLAVESARHLGEEGLAMLSRMRVQRARPYLKQERFDDARADAEAGLVAARRSGHTLATVTALEALGRVHFERGRITEATAHYTEALELATESGDPRAVVVERHQVARCQLAARCPEEALRTLETVYTEVNQLPKRDRYNEARIRTSLGEALTLLGDGAGALAHLSAALDLFSEIAADEQVADVLALRADVRDSSGDRDGAARDLQDSYTLYTLLDSPRASRVAARLRR